MCFFLFLTAVRETATLSLNKVHLGLGLYFKFLLAPGKVPQQLKTSPAWSSLPLLYKEHCICMEEDQLLWIPYLWPCLSLYNHILDVLSCLSQRCSSAPHLHVPLQPRKHNPVPHSKKAPPDHHWPAAQITCDMSTQPWAASECLMHNSLFLKWFLRVFLMADTPSSFLICCTVASKSSKC